ncbi:hypothetical protein JEOAER750_02177 [Jeotgalicoccus aerolatus]|uniref:Uncharacterized protein YfkK (UPF0435 family) n=1 Tax=Jeotgalicoccus aerolatus TaxID=709510 RepID=A0A1G8Y6T1_9STAP|nr:DUF1128 family protein [Jeotgalicoccus aerolatus]MBP1952725.1 uncharacterized protein YfkK (UPF0435 family) [Jeotgalicoccus aerolatus]NMA80652.1 DUF1128 family protein [Jeotgalicoccus aerolatus]CAD2080905.1 hypothetical protein JEOAER750_02177 [Jeotgalicoccus aerolatus]SDJ98548.1 Uncharacterized protein YfkK, UPF0435 family [Jeotgalicoccus aerolatus]GGE08661.1 hypothetical protein GCM10007273_21230 [Jeotgalicoccus aerolatus]
MDKTQILEDIVQKLNVVNRGIFKPDDYSDEKVSELNDIKEMLESRGQISAAEQSAVIEELSKMRKQ